MKNYLLANFRLHNFKGFGYRKLANVHKSMQICEPFVQKNKKQNCFLYKFLGKITSPKTVFFPISNFCYYLTQPTVLYNMYISDCQIWITENPKDGVNHCSIQYISDCWIWITENPKDGVNHCSIHTVHVRMNLIIRNF